MSETGDGPARVERAFRQAIGEQGRQWMHRRSKHVADLTPVQVAQQRGGDRA